MKCPVCGTENRDTARFCRHCGQPLTAPPAPEPEAPAETLAEGQAEAPAEAQAETPGEAQAEMPVETQAEVPAEVLTGAAAPVAEAGSQDQAPPAPDELQEARPEVAAPEQPVEAAPEGAPQPAPAEAAEEAPAPPEAAAPEGAPEHVAEEGPPPEEGEEVAFWRESAPPLEPVPAGTVIDGRYAIMEALDVQDGQILYQAQDLQRCWQCGYEGNAPSEAFCARCGAALDHKPQVRLLQVVDAEAAPAGDEPVVAHLEDEGRYFLVLGEPQTASAPAAASGAIRLLSGQQSVPGQVRDLNEDSLLVLTLAPVFQSQVQPLIGLFVVADGMGGHSGGELASKLALQVFAGDLLRELVLPALATDQPAAIPDDAIAERLRQAVSAANDALFLARQKRDSDMGTTLTAALVWDTRLFVAHVGDSRAYRWNASGLQQLTTDHSVVATMVASGQITPDEIYTHPHRSVIYRSIGDKPSVQVDTGTWPLSPGDRLLVCSDGVWEMIRTEGIQDGLMAESDPQAACDLLASRANAAGGEDNISVIVVQVETD